MSILDTIYNEMYVYYKYCCFIYSNKKEGKQYILIFFNNISEDYFLLIVRFPSCLLLLPSKLGHVICLVSIFDVIMIASVVIMLML